jgi:nitrate reductase molybdenum cofactor assembly chaperone NarJ/NarW
MRLLERSKTIRARTPYKLLSVLLGYPDQHVLEAEAELEVAIAALPASKQRDALERFWAHWKAASPTERAQQYVETFDLQKRCSLYLSFYLHGDKRQRGTSLLRLKRLYAAAGLVLESNELPDYLPVVLEFAELAPAGYGESILAEYRPAIEVARASLHDRGSSYAHLLDALCYGLPRLSPLEAERVQRIVAEGPPSEQVGLEPFAPPEVMPNAGARR